jgi:hypothetical protein
MEDGKEERRRGLRSEVGARLVSLKGRSALHPPISSFFDHHAFKTLLRFFQHARVCRRSTWRCALYIFTHTYPRPYHRSSGSPPLPKIDLDPIHQIVSSTHPLNNSFDSSSPLYSIATFSGDLSSLTAPPFILSPVSLTEFPGAPSNMFNPSFRNSSPRSVPYLIDQRTGANVRSSSAR